MDEGKAVSGLAGKRIIYTSDVASVLGWTPRRARRWLLKTGAGRRRGGRVVTSIPELLLHLPGVGQALLEQAEKDAADDDCDV